MVNFVVVFEGFVVVMQVVIGDGDYLSYWGYCVDEIEYCVFVDFGG